MKHYVVLQYFVGTKNSIKKQKIDFLVNLILKMKSGFGLWTITKTTLTPTAC
jgi:hypothetical protein